jgi:hypothetical protein
VAVPDFPVMISDREPQSVPLRNWRSTSVQRMRMMEGTNEEAMVN